MNESLKNPTENNAEAGIQNLLVQHPEIVKMAVPKLSEESKKGLEDEFAQIEEDERKDLTRPASRSHTAEDYEHFREDVAREAVKKDLLKISPEGIKKLNDDLASIDWDERQDFANPGKQKHTKEDYDHFRQEAVSIAFQELEPKAEAAPGEPDVKEEKATPAAEKKESKTTIAEIDGLNLTESTIRELEATLAQIDEDEQKDYANSNKISHKHTKEEYASFRKKAINGAIEKDLRKLSRKERQRFDDTVASIKEDEQKDYANPNKISHKHTKEEYAHFRREAIAEALKSLHEEAPEQKPAEAAPAPTPEQKPAEATPAPAPEQQTVPPSEPKGASAEMDKVSDDAKKLETGIEDLEAKIKALEGRMAELTANTNSEDKEATARKAKRQALRRLGKIRSEHDLEIDILHDAGVLWRKIEAAPLYEITEELLAQVDELEKRANSAELNGGSEAAPERRDDDDGFTDEKKKELASLESELAKLQEEQDANADTVERNQKNISRIEEERKNIEKQLGIMNEEPLVAVDVDVTSDRDKVARDIARKFEKFGTLSSKKRILISKIWSSKLFPGQRIKEFSKQLTEGELKLTDLGGEKTTVNQLITESSRGVVSRFVRGAVESMARLYDKSKNERLNAGESLAEADQETTDKVRAEIERYIDERPKAGENLEDLRRELNDRVKKIVAESISKKAKSPNILSVGNYDEVAEEAYRRYNDYVEAATQARIKAEHDVAMACVMTGFRLYFGEARDETLRDSKQGWWLNTE